MISAILKAAFLLFLFVQAVLINPGSSAELKQGQYLGWIKFNESEERLAVVAEFLVESENDYTQFPKLKAVFKLSLGGYNTHEYITETFEEIQYDFDNEIMTLDDLKNDLFMSVRVSSQNAGTVLSGTVFIRSSGTLGTLYLLQKSDEPEDINLAPSDEENAPFLPLLAGQYEGLCNGKEAMIQFQTVRGLEASLRPEPKANLLNRFYGVVGRLAYKNSLLCTNLEPNQWCSVMNFDGVSYNFFLGKLNLYGERSADECLLKNGQLQCRIWMVDRTIQCDLNKKESVIQPAVFFERQYNVRASAEQMLELPSEKPPEHTHLAAALQGEFFGYLHNETNNTYEEMRLSVQPFTSTDNPHNSNQIRIAVSASIYLGTSVLRPFITQRFESRTFYLRPGFTLSGPDTDSFMSVLEWKRGYIRGIWHSKAFGKVGSVQLIKGERPLLPVDAKRVQAVNGVFRGPMGTGDTRTPTRWMKVVLPTLPSDLIDHLIVFRGSYQVMKITPVQIFESGTFDHFTGAFGWKMTREGSSTFVSGFIDSQSNAHLFWPPISSILGAVSPSFGYEPYLREEGL